MFIKVSCSLFLAIFTTFGAFAEPTLPNPHGPRPLHVLLIGDTKHSSLRGADLSSGCRNSINALQHYVFVTVLGEPGEKYTLDVLDEEAASPQGVRDYFAKKPIPSGGRLFVYYCGHGAFDEEEKEAHFLAMGRGDLPREELRQLILDTKPVGAFLFTDACSTFMKMGLAPLAPAPDDKLFTHLFLRTEGLVDITAAKPGEKAWFNENGGIFTDALTNLMVTEVPFVDGDRNGIVTWPEAFAFLSEKTQERFVNFRNLAPPNSILHKVAPQTPHSFYLGEWPNG